MKLLSKVFICLFIVGLLLTGLQVRKIAQATGQVDYAAQLFQRLRPDAGFKILFMGDSTAVGVGSPAPAASTAGWFGKDFPEASIENISQSGLRLAGLREKLNLVHGDHYDLIVLQIGANDIMHMTTFGNIDSDVRAILEFCRSKSDHIAILHSGNIGTAPIFIWPFSWILSERSYYVREIYKRAAHDNRAVYVDLIDYGVDKLCIDHPEKYYATDHLHLSGEGYRVWYGAIRASLAKAGVQFESPVLK